MTAQIKLDYSGMDEAGKKEQRLLKNLSGIAAHRDYLWTVSDELRSVECLKAKGDGYKLVQQFYLDDVFSGLEGKDEKGGGAELDIESIDIADDYLWLCGSHCRVRKTRKGNDDPDHLSAKIKSRPSRHFLAKIHLVDKGGAFDKGKKLQSEGSGSLREVLKGNPFLDPFIDLPSKENGLDIEGMVATKDGVILGLRGPRLDGKAVAIHLSLNADMDILGYRLSFLDIEGLVIRDMARTKDGLLLIAGPVGDTSGPYALYHWEGLHSDLVQHPTKLSSPFDGQEKPEGICELPYKNNPGKIILYDSPEEAKRLSGMSYLADWVE